MKSQLQAKLKHPRELKFSSDILVFKYCAQGSLLNIIHCSRMFDVILTDQTDNMLSL